MLRQKGVDDVAEKFWGSSDPVRIEDQSAEFIAGLLSLGHIKAALRRSARFWSAITLIGLCAGLGYGLARPSTYQASTSIILPQDAQNPAADDIATDVALAQSRTVAAAARATLHSTESITGFRNTYTATALTKQILLITATAQSAKDALHEASAVAVAFLRFRANEQQAGQRAALDTLDSQVRQAKQQVKSFTDKIERLSAGSGPPAQLSALRIELGQATNALSSANSNIAQENEQTALQLKESRVLDAASLMPHSWKKTLALAGVIGLIAGLVLSVSIVVLRATVSDRLYRRDEVAGALGAPVELSIGKVRLGRGWPQRHGIASTQDRGIRRIVGYLRKRLPRSSVGGAASLAVVAVDNPRVASACLASLAVSCARDGLSVVLADLVEGAPAARLLGMHQPGIRATHPEGVRVVVAIPDPETAVPLGPYHRRRRSASDMTTSELDEACASADILLTLTALDPSLGGEYLVTWANDAVAMVTAGQASWTRVYAVGEMMRLADVRSVSAVLVGADKTDDSLGVIDSNRVGGNGNPMHDAYSWKE